MLISLTEACSFLKNCGDTVILIHQSPDGDCIGAGHALREILRAMGKRCRVECSDKIPARYNYLGCNDINAEDTDFEPENIISADVADVKLLGTLKEKYGDRIQLCIDHHVSNIGFAEKTLLYPEAAATCEIVYFIAKELGIELTDRMAACIYTGIATDTGCFKYDNTTPECHEIAAELKRGHKLNYARINRDMFDVKSPGRIKIECAAAELMEYYFGGKLTMVVITVEMMRNAGVDESGLEGCASLPLQPEGVEVGAMIKEREPGAYKVSLRSANDVNVSEICKTFGGGGHAKAAGCLIKGDIDDVKKRLAEAVGKALEQI